MGDSDTRDCPGGGNQIALPARPLGYLFCVAVGLREPVVAILLAIAFFTTISGKPVDGVLMLIGGLSLAWDTGRAGRGGTAAPESPAPAGLGGPGAPGAPARGGVAGRVRAVWESSRLFTALMLTGAALYVGVVGSFSRYSWPATVGVVGLGTAVVMMGWRDPPRRPAAARLPGKGTAAWGALFIAGCLWELAALLEQPTLTASSYTHPTISALTDPVLAGAPGRWAVLACWLALGWYLVER